MWDDIIEDEIFIGQTEGDLNQEIRTNMWSISMSREQRTNTSLDQLLAFFRDVMANRREQIRHSQANHGMWFYIWHDQQASQLRFSLISNFHTKLPFEAEVISANLETILEEFLNSLNHIPLSPFDVYDYDPEKQRAEQDTPPFVLPVFMIQLL